MKVNSLVVRYDEKLVLDHFSAEFGNGITCIAGPSGYGKTTLLSCIAGLIVPESGTIEGRPERICMMFQEDRLFPWMSALENITVVCDDEEKARHYLRAVEIGNEEASMPRELSGGMRRRVALARALAFESDMLLMDEPFKGMDLPLVERLVPLIREKNIPVILSTHSPEEQAIIGGKILEMDKL